MVRMYGHDGDDDDDEKKDHDGSQDGGADVEAAGSGAVGSGTLQISSQPLVSGLQGTEHIDSKRRLIAMFNLKGTQTQAQFYNLLQKLLILRVLFLPLPIYSVLKIVIPLIFFSNSTKSSKVQEKFKVCFSDLFFCNFFHSIFVFRCSLNSFKP